jgi:hypothetical protein
MPLQYSTHMRWRLNRKKRFVCWCFVQRILRQLFSKNSEESSKRILRPRGRSESDVKKFVDTGCICTGKSSGRPSTSAETAGRVRQAHQRSPRKSTRRASRELNVPQPNVRNILRKRLAVRPYRLKLKGSAFIAKYLERSRISS